MPKQSMSSLKPSRAQSDCGQIMSFQARKIALDLAGVGAWQSSKMQRYFDDQKDGLSARLLRLSEDISFKKSDIASSITSSGQDSC